MNKTILTFCILTLLLSCGKEKSYETSGKTTSTFTFGGAPDMCTSATVAGIFVKGVMLTSSNTVTIDVDVAVKGSYKITTDTVNGYYFAGTGTFSSTGVQSIELTSQGTPLVSGTDDFTLSAGNNIPGCSFSITVLDKAPEPAVYTLSGNPSTCSSFIVNGSYGKDLVVNSSNTVTVNVNVTTAGTYTIKTDTISGFSFSASGIFSSTGTQQVILKGNGTPKATGDLLFTVKTGSSTCTFTVTVSGPATYTFTGGTGNCTNAVVNGTYTASSALTGSNTVSIQVNVTAIGAYSISTNTVNGISFSASGTFTSTGAQEVILNGTGTPSAEGSNSFILNGNGCSFSVTVAAAPAGAGIFKCKIDGTLIDFSENASAMTKNTLVTPATNLLDISGDYIPTNGDDQSFSINIQYFTGSAIGNGTYTEKGATGLSGYIIVIQYVKDVTESFQTMSNATGTTNPAFTIVVTSATSTRIKGTFSGKLAPLLGGSNVTVTEGVFDVPVEN